MESISSMAQIAEVFSKELRRTVRVDFYETHEMSGDDAPALLVMNDGQDLVTMDFASILDKLVTEGSIQPLVVAAVHSGADRHQEYGVAAGPNYRGWGSRAAAYSKFITDELCAFIQERYGDLREKSIAGFSLGALSALDIAWNNANIFSSVGVFSGSLWWRSVDKEDRNYNPWVHRMMHHQIANTPAPAGMRFFFQCGEHDEEEDRNKNGVIDAIDDTIDVMRLLLEKGFLEGRDFVYMQLPDGRHDVASWAKAVPAFLRWLRG